jgi:hypothetical protein
MIDRSEASRALAKAIAYKQCGKHASAELWAARLIGLLECHDIINPSRTGLVSIAHGGEFTDVDLPALCK